MCRTTTRGRVRSRRRRTCFPKVFFWVPSRVVTCLVCVTDWSAKSRSRRNAARSRISRVSLGTAFSVRVSASASTPSHGSNARSGVANPPPPARRGTTRARRGTGSRVPITRTEPLRLWPIGTFSPRTSAKGRSRSAKDRTPHRAHAAPASGVVTVATTGAYRACTCRRYSAICGDGAIAADARANANGEDRSTRREPGTPVPRPVPRQSFGVHDLVGGLTKTTTGLRARPFFEARGAWAALPPARARGARPGARASRPRTRSWTSPASRPSARRKAAGARELGREGRGKGNRGGSAGSETRRRRGRRRGRAAFERSRTPHARVYPSRDASRDARASRPPPNRRRLAVRKKHEDLRCASSCSRTRRASRRRARDRAPSWWRRTRRARPPAPLWIGSIAERLAGHAGAWPAWDIRMSTKGKTPRRDATRGLRERRSVRADRAATRRRRRDV